MIAPEATSTPYTTSHPRQLPAPALDDRPTPAQTLAKLYRRCGPGGGCLYSMSQILDVLTALRDRGPVVATEIAATVGLPASAVYGCVLECEDYGLCRWIPEPVLTADYITAEITATGSRLLRELNLARGVGHAG